MKVCAVEGCNNLTKNRNESCSKTCANQLRAIRRGDENACVIYGRPPDSVLRQQFMMPASPLRLEHRARMSLPPPILDDAVIDALGGGL